MWEIRLVNHEMLEEKSFEFSNGQFVDDRKVIRFANGQKLSMVKICKIGGHEPIYIEPTLFSQLVIYDGQNFVFGNMYRRLFQNFKKTSVLIELVELNTLNQGHTQSLMESTIVTISATLGAYLKDMVESFCLNRGSFIRNGAIEVYKSTYKQYLKSFNNPSSHNIKGLLKKLNLYPEVIESIDYAKIDEMVELRNKIAHGGVVEPDLSVEIVHEYLEETKNFMLHVSSNVYRNVAKYEEMSLWPTTIGNQNEIDKFWSLLPLMFEE